MSTASTSTLPSVRQLQSRLLLALLGITLAVFGGVCGHEFVHFDDNVNIYNNPHVQGLTWENIHWMFTNASYARRYMPLGWLSYAVDYQLFGLSPRSYHIGNLLLHLINVALVFFLLKRLLLLARIAARPEDGGTAPVWCAAIGALFWAVNPLRVESVAWASARVYGVAFCFTAVWLLAWLRAQEPGTPEPRRLVFYWVSVAAYAASLLTYPLALFAPVALFVLEVYPLRRVSTGLRPWLRPEAWRVWRDKLPFLAAGAGVLALAFLARVQTDAASKPMTLEEFPVFSRGMQALYIWAYYLWKPWAPYDLTITYMTLHSFDPLAWPFLLSTTVVIGGTFAFWVLRRRWPILLGLWICHLVLLVPVLGLTEYPHSAYDRYSHLHDVLWSVVLALGLERLWAHGSRGRLAGLVVAGASALFALLAWQQVSVWRGTIPLYENLLAHTGHHPDRARFDTVLGVHYLHAGLTNEAIASFQSAVHYEPLRPDRRFLDEGVLPVAHAHLADVYAQQGQLEEAFSHYRAAAQADPGGAWIAAKAGSMLVQLDRYEEAVEWLKTAARLKPDSPETHHTLALALRKLGREQEALQHLQEERRLLARNSANSGS